jgi:hypothetical protein
VCANLADSPDNCGQCGAVCPSATPACSLLGDAGIGCVSSITYDISYSQLVNVYTFCDSTVDPYADCGGEGFSWADAAPGVAPTSITATFDRGVMCTAGIDYTLFLNGVSTGGFNDPAPGDCTCNPTPFEDTLTFTPTGYLSGVSNTLTLTAVGECESNGFYQDPSSGFYATVTVTY